VSVRKRHDVGAKALQIAAAGAASALAAIAAGCGAHHTEFCGLARTVNGFDPVEAVRGVACAQALAAVAAVERGRRGDWNCSRAMHATFELDCRRAAAEMQVLERTPVPASLHDGVVSLANWSFRLRAGRMQGREPPGRWLDLGGPPFCEPAVPREALLALRLQPLTPSGGCFSDRRS
jgi:hypothetical protein